MRLPVFLRPEAEEDLIAARDWYEQCRPGLGLEMVAQVAAAFDQIGAMPEMYALAWHDVRSCRVRRFPYLVHYRILPARVEVLAVLHGSRDPADWQRRA